jgi:acetoacetate decarboxylase
MVIMMDLLRVIGIGWSRSSLKLSSEAPACIGSPSCVKLVSSFVIVAVLAMTPNTWCGEPGFSMPVTSPLYPAPPWNYQNNKAIVIMFETTRDAIREILPKPLGAHAANYAFVYIGKYNIQSPTKLSFHEAGIGIPASYETTQGKYAAFQYTDKLLPIAGGREIWGSPKKDAQITLEEKGKRVTATVVRGGKTIIRASLNKDMKLKPDMGWPEAPWFSLKLIPSVRQGAPPDVWQLTAITVKDRFKELYAGKGTLEFNSTPEDPLGKFTILGLVAAQFAVYDFDLGYGEVLHDYLSGRKQ